MVASQTLAVLGGLLTLLPTALVEQPSRVSLQSVIQSYEAPHSVTKVDHRRIVDARLSPYSAIGKFRGTMTCTAAIVLNPRIIITAGHCVTERDGTIRRSNLSFQRGYQTGTDLGSFRATVWAVGSQQSFTHESVRDASRDWAILILDRAPAGVQPFLLSHRSLRAVELLERQILLPGDALVHTCTTRPGSSGAPLLVRDGQGYAIIGIHTASMFASDEHGHIAKFVGNQASASWMFSDAAFELSRQLDGAPVQTVNSADY